MVIHWLTDDILSWLMLSVCKDDVTEREALVHILTEPWVGWSAVKFMSLLIRGFGRLIGSMLMDWRGVGESPGNSWLTETLRTMQMNWRNQYKDKQQIFSCVNICIAWQGRGCSTIIGPCFRGDTRYSTRTQRSAYKATFPLELNGAALNLTHL